MTLTTAEAAAYLGTTAAAVRQLVHRGRLRPVRGSARPLRFRWDEVERARVARMPARERSRLDEMAERWEVS